MRGPPGLPSTRQTAPFSPRRIVGESDDSGRLPGAIWFAAPPTRPNWLGAARGKANLN